jgi:hypothetical protein
LDTLGARLKEHETSVDHVLNMTTWYELRNRLQTDQAIKRKRHYDENPDVPDVATLSAEESFRISYFIPIVDQAISSLTRRFEQYQGYQKIFGFLFTSKTLQSLDNESLKSSCVIIWRLPLKGMENLVLMPMNCMQS